MKYRIVQVAEHERGRDWQVKDVDDISAFMASVGAQLQGITASPQLRPELQGQPIYDKFAGPCWGGVEEGESIVRYESWRAYEILST